MIIINTLAEQVKQSMESHSEIVHLDPWDGGMCNWSYDPEKTRKVVRFVAAVYQRGGLERTAEWF